tara:strand:- start:60 stop:404 length:345 start_codon:yes stop_codon:yes gene_type:complete
MKLQEVLELSKELIQLNSEKLKLSEKWEIKKTFEATKQHSEDFEKLRNEALEKYGVLADDKKSYSFPEKGSLENFNTEVSELLNKEIEIKSNISFEKIDDLETEYPYDKIHLLR